MVNKMVIQFIITFVLLFFAYGFIVVAFDAVADNDYPDYKVLHSDIQHGNYGSAMDYYDTVKSLHGIDGPEYEQYTEFYKFYNDYLLYTEYEAAGSHKIAEGYLENIKKICEKTQYFEMKSHYEYLVGTIK